MGIEVECVVECYEVDGKEVEIGGDRPKLRVLSHWNNDHMVILKIGTKTWTVVAEHLDAAVTNATRTAK